MSQRDDLLAGARKCLIEKGYSHTTARDIAAASGAHLASIGYHYGSKDRLMNTAVLAATGEWGDALDDAVRSVGVDESSQRFAALLGTLFEAIPRARDLHVASVQALAQAQFDDTMRDALAAGFRSGREGLATMLLEAAPDQVTPDVRQALGSVVYALVTGYVVQMLIDPDAVPEVEAVIAAIRTLLPAQPQP